MINMCAASSGDELWQTRLRRENGYPGNRACGGLKSRAGLGTRSGTKCQSRARMKPAAAAFWGLTTKQQQKSEEIITEKSKSSFNHLEDMNYYLSLAMRRVCEDSRNRRRSPPGYRNPESGQSGDVDNYHRAT
jgi:hypothetical protein